MPLPIHHFGGGFLWGAMVYACMSVALPWRASARLFVTLVLIAAVESFRLVHSPGLDAFRLTLAGQLLLGRVFAPWNIVVDGAGAAFVAALTRRVT